MKMLGDEAAVLDTEAKGYGKNNSLDEVRGMQDLQELGPQVELTLSIYSLNTNRNWYSRKTVD